MKRAQGHGGTEARHIGWMLAFLTVPLCARAFVPAALAQDSPAIRSAVQLAAEGRGDSARKIVAAELARARPGDAAYVEALYWRGRLAASGDSAEADLRRVAIDYSNSRWADHALLQLAQLAMAAGNPTGALQLTQRLRSDYPGTTLRSRAALWGGRAAFDVGDPATACALLDSARTEAAGDIEFVNEVGFYRSRCAALPPPGPAPANPPPDSTKTPGADSTRRTPAAAAPAAPPRAPQFEVQVTATRSKSRAQSVVHRVERAGYDGRAVAGADGYLRVRAGPYASRREADAAVVRLRRLLGGHPIVVPAP
jgi:hypothetical protein